MLYRLLCFFLILFMTSCAFNNIGFVPAAEELPEAKVGKYYEQEILIGTNLEDRPEFLTKENITLRVYPTDIGLHVVPKYKRRDGLFVYNYLLIRGTPLLPGKVKVDISGHTYGSMYTKSSTFNKRYTLEVK